MQNVKRKLKTEYINTIDYFYSIEGLAKGSVENVYVPRFDWKQGKILARPDSIETLGCQQWLSPPPFCLCLKLDNFYTYVGMAPYMVSIIFEYDYIGGEDGAYYQLTYEGHTAVEDEFETPHVVIGFGPHTANESIDNYICFLRNNAYLPKIESKKISKWWKEPIFCGWGEMRYNYRYDHDGQENGTFINVTRYATQATYEHYMQILDEKV